MRYIWKFGTATLTERDLAEFARKHAHDFYARANRFRVQESDGYEGRGGEESVYREDAFQTAADHYGVDYNVFYEAWLNKEPVEFLHRAGTCTCRHCGIEGPDTGGECPRCERNRDTGRMEA